MSKTAPAIPFFGDAYMADTRHLSLEEHGAYMLLLMIAWRSADCALPDDDKRIAQMLGITAPKWRKLKPSIMEFWTLKEGRWTQARLTKERAFVTKKSKQNADAANARWSGKSLKNNKRANANASPAHSERNAPPPTNNPSGYTRAREIPSDWKPDEFGDGTKSKGVVEGWTADQHDEQVERFIAYHRGKGTKRKSWQDSWSTWVLNSRVYGSGPRRPEPKSDSRPLYAIINEQPDRAAGAGR